MGRFAKTVLATAMVGAGMTVLIPGAAIADEGNGDEQEGLVNVNDTQAIVPVNVCDNNVAVSLIQVVVQDVVVNIPILNRADDGSKQDNSGGKSCENDVTAKNF